MVIHTILHIHNTVIIHNFLTGYGHVTSMSVNTGLQNDESQ